MLGVAFIVITATVFRIFLIMRDSVPFAYDMGRDLLWAKDIVFYKTPTLIGPAASIWGVYFGPLWFYFLSVPLLISGGHPISAPLSTAATIVATGILAYILFKDTLGHYFALTLSTLILFGGTLINISTFAFHANVLPLLTLLMIYFCYISVVKKSIYVVGAFLSTSLMFHADPAPAVVSTFIPLATLLIFKLYKSKNFQKTLLLSVLAYLTPFIPQILFELRNNFIQTKSLLAYFLGENPSLSGQLPFFARITDRLNIFFDFFKDSMAGQNQILALLFLIAVCLGVYFCHKKIKDKQSMFSLKFENKNLKILLYLNLLVILLTFLIFTVVVTVEIKQWYLYGMPVVFAFLITFAIMSIRQYRLITATLLVLFVLLNIAPFAKSQKVLSTKLDPATLRNQISAIDLIYSDFQGAEFSVYVFTPAIYDYNYQYLFWWHGIRLGKGLPQDFAYLPNQPEYVRNKNFYVKSSQTTDLIPSHRGTSPLIPSHRGTSPLIYLIIENAPENEFYTRQNWLKNFDNFQLVWGKDINNSIVVMKRQK